MEPVAQSANDLTVDAICSEFQMISSEPSLARLWTVMGELFVAKAQSFSRKSIQAHTELSTILPIITETPSNRQDIAFAKKLCEQLYEFPEPHTTSSLLSLFSSKPPIIEPSLRVLWSHVRALFEELQHGQTAIFNALLRIANQLLLVNSAVFDKSCLNIIVTLLLHPPVGQLSENAIPRATLFTYYRSIFTNLFAHGGVEQLLDFVYIPHACTIQATCLIDLLVERLTLPRDLLRKIAKRALTDVVCQRLLSHIKEAKSDKTLFCAIILRFEQYRLIPKEKSGLHSLVSFLRLAIASELALEKLQRVTTKNPYLGNYYKKDPLNPDRSLIINPKFGIFWLSKSKVVLIDIKGVYKRITSVIYAPINPKAHHLVAVESVNLTSRQEIGVELGRRELQLLDELEGVECLVQRLTYAIYQHSLGINREIEKIAIVWEHYDIDLERLLRVGAIPVDAQIGIAYDVMRAISGMHVRKIFHGDLKPNNILCALLGDAYRAVICDFGLTIRESEFSSYGTIQLQGTYGSLLHTAPELLGEVHFQGDFYKAEAWALGALLYKMFLGKSLPWEELVYKHLRLVADHSMMRQLSKSIGEFLDKLPATKDPYLKLIYQLLERDPEKRITVGKAKAILGALRSQGKENPRPTS